MINYPQNPNVGDEFDTGTVTFMWDGVKWKAVTVGGRTIISYANTESMQNSRPTQMGQRVENRERANAQYELAESGYTALPGDIVAANGRVWKLVGGSYNQTLTVNIPSHYPTMQEAIDYYHNKILFADGNELVINIEAGHQLKAPLHLSGGNYSYVKITSDDPSVLVEDNSVFLADFRQNIEPVFFAKDGCIFPYIDILIDVQGYTGFRQASGFLCVEGSLMNLSESAGCLGGFYGVIAYDGSTVNCRGCDFRFSVEAGITAWSNSKIYAENANASESQLYGVRSTEGASLVFKGGTAINCARHAARAVASAFLDVTSADLRNSATKGVYARHSCIVMANFVNVTNSAEDGIYSQRGSIVTCIESDASGSANGFRAESAGEIICPNSIANSCTVTAVAASRASKIEAQSITALDCLGNCVLAEDMSEIQVNNSTLTGASSSAIRASGGSKVYAENSDAKGSGGNALYSLGGSEIVAHGVDASNSQRGAVAQGGKISCNGGTFNNCSDGLYALDGGEINGLNVNATGCASRGLLVIKSKAFVPDSDFSGASTNGVRVTEGGEVNLRNCNCRISASSSVNDISITSGLVYVDSTLGGSNLAVNALTASGALIGNLS